MGKEQSERSRESGSIPGGPPQATHGTAVKPHSQPIPVAFPFSGDSIGGSHISVLGLLRHLDRRRFHPIIIPEVAGGRIASMFGEFETLADPGARAAPFAPGEPFNAPQLLRPLL